MEILKTPATPEMEAEHRKHYDKQKSEALEKAAKDTKDSTATQLQPFKSLEETKLKILANAEALEKEKLCSKVDGYQGLLNAVAQDIRNQRIYRKQRKAEIAKLTLAIEHLETKKGFYMSQIDAYDQYVGSCVNNMAKGGQTKRGGLMGFLGIQRNKPSNGKDEEGGQYFGSFKYTAAKLKDKGVLVSIDGVPDSKLGLVKLEIFSDEVGVFQFKVSDFMGTQREETHKLVFQDLLQMQYENVHSMKLFGVANVNINLLIFLINKKFLNK